MRAVRFHAYGGPDVLRVEEVQAPAIGPDDVLLDVDAAGVNPLDWKIRSGALAQLMPLPLPFILGWDVAGTIASVGENVRGFMPGNAVFGMIPIGATGAYAEKAVIPASALASKPQALAPNEAAAIPVVGLAAYQLVRGQTPVEPGQTVLVLGAAGNVGRLCVALAQHDGAQEIAAGKKADLDRVDWPSEVTLLAVDKAPPSRGALAIDVLIDTVGGEVLETAITFVRPGGRLVSTVQPPDVSRAQEITGEMLQVVSDAAALKELGDLFVAGTLPIPRVTPFDMPAVARAHAIGEAEHAGKLVLSMRAT